MKHIILTLVTMGLLGATVIVATAQERNGPQQGERGRRGPPPEAIEACADLSEGDVCSVELRDGQTHQGTCAAGPNGEEALACRPDDMPERPDRERR